MTAVAAKVREAMLYGGTLGGGAGALVGWYHRLTTIRYELSKTGSMTYEPVGAFGGLIIGGVCGVILYVFLRRLRPLLRPWVTGVLSAIGVAIFGAALSLGMTD